MKNNSLVYSILKKNAVIFDLDGVLLDSKSNMEVSWNLVQKTFQIKTSFDDYFKLIGRPFPDIIDLLKLTQYMPNIQKVYKAESIRNFDTTQKLFPRVNETLVKLRKNGIKIAIVTSKERERTEIVLKNINIDFSSVQCPMQGYRGKPAPDQLLLAVAECNEDPKNCIFIGDMQSDHEASIRGGVSYMHADWGYGNPIPTQKVDHLNSIQDMIKLFGLDK